MSPEQAQGLAVDARSDLFSLGMTLFRCVTGTALYGEGTAFELLVRAAAGPKPADLDRVHRAPTAIAVVLERALQPEPAARFASATEFEAALPPVPSGAAAEVGQLISKHFAEELEKEQASMNAATQTFARGAVAT